MRQSGEPTVEEILDSIKQVIARDNRADAASEPRRRMSESAARPAPSHPAESVPADDVLDLADSALVEEDGADSAEASDGDAEPMVAATTQNSMRESLAALAMLAEPGAQPRIVRSGETSVEDLVRELLRPAISEWLDSNLPPLVERMVAAEIRRISGSRG